MPEDLKKVEAVFAEWPGPDFRIVTIECHIEDEKDALEIAEDIALLEGSEFLVVKVLTCAQKEGGPGLRPSLLDLTNS